MVLLISWWFVIYSPSVDSPSSLRFAPSHGIRLDSTLRFAPPHRDSPKLSWTLAHIDKADTRVTLIPPVTAWPNTVKYCPLLGLAYHGFVPWTHPKRRLTVCRPVFYLYTQHLSCVLHVGLFISRWVVTYERPEHSGIRLTLNYVVSCGSLWIPSWTPLIHSFRDMFILRKEKACTLYISEMSHLYDMISHVRNLKKRIRNVYYLFLRKVTLLGTRFLWGLPKSTLEESIGTFASLATMSPLLPYNGSCPILVNWVPYKTYMIYS